VNVEIHHLPQRVQDLDAQFLFFILQQPLRMLYQPEFNEKKPKWIQIRMILWITGTQLSYRCQNNHIGRNEGNLKQCQIMLCRALKHGIETEVMEYLWMNRPLWHFLRAPVSAGKRYSGWNKTSTMTDDSACTSGCSCASSSTTMSCNPSIMLRSTRTPN